MGEVKWIKLSVNMFEDEKIRLIRSMPEGNSILLVWIYLLVLAGKCNDSGYIYLAEDMPYTDEMLATVMDMPLNTVRLAIETFRRLKMIELDNGCIYISNWEKHQNIEGLERIREQTRLRVKRHRNRAKLKKLNIETLKELAKSHHIKEYEKMMKDQLIQALDDVTLHETLRNALEEDIEEEEEEGDKDIYIEPPTPYKKIQDLFNSICKSYPEVIAIGSARKRHLQARWKQFDYDVARFEEAFKKLEGSEFCKGNNDHGWKASFDWLIKNDGNMIKVLEGKYDDKTKGGGIPDTTDSKYGW